MVPNPSIGSLQYQDLIDFIQIIYKWVSLCLMSGLQSHDSVVLGYPHGTGTKVEVGGWVWVHTRGAQTTYMGSPSSERKVRFQI